MRQQTHVKLQLRRARYICKFVKIVKLMITLKNGSKRLKREQRDNLHQKDIAASLWRKVVI